MASPTGGSSSNFPQYSFSEVTEKGKKEDQVVFETKGKEQTEGGKTTLTYQVQIGGVPHKITVGFDKEALKAAYGSEQQMRETIDKIVENMTAGELKALVGAVATTTITEETPKTTVKLLNTNETFTLDELKNGSAGSTQKSPEQLQQLGKTVEKMAHLFSEAKSSRPGSSEPRSQEVQSPSTGSETAKVVQGYRSRGELPPLPPSKPSVPSRDKRPSTEHDPKPESLAKAIEAQKARAESLAKTTESEKAGGKPEISISSEQQTRGRQAFNPDVYRVKTAKREKMHEFPPIPSLPRASTEQSQKSESVKTTETSSAPTAKYFHHAKELRQTEFNYYTDMSNLLNALKLDERVTQKFGEQLDILEQLLNHSGEILEQLDQCIKEDHVDDEGLKKLFQSDTMKETCALFGQYGNTGTKLGAHLDKMVASDVEKGKETPLRAFAKKEGQETSIQTQMIKPTQRGPRYAMLLDDMAKQTASSSQTHANITDAAESLKKIMSEANEKIERDFTGIEKLVEQNIKPNDKIFFEDGRFKIVLTEEQAQAVIKERSLRSTTLLLATHKIVSEEEAKAIETTPFPINEALESLFSGAKDFTIEDQKVVRKAARALNKNLAFKEALKQQDPEIQARFNTLSEKPTILGQTKEQVSQAAGQAVNLASQTASAISQATKIFPKKKESK